MSYATRNRRPPRTLTDDECERLLRVSGKDREGFRDHVIFSLALGCGLRESEIVGLNVGVLLTDTRLVRRVIYLDVYKRGPKTDPNAQRVEFPESTYYKLEKYARVFKLADYYADAPVFWSRKGNRLSVRAVRALFRRWQRAAGFDHFYSFHKLRHTAITRVRRETKDLSVANRFARHASIETTKIYDHVSDEELSRAVRGLPA